MFDSSLPIDEQIEWHTEATSGACHAYLAEVLKVDLLAYTATCNHRGLKVYITNACVQPFCPRCAAIVTAAGGTDPRGTEEPRVHQ